MKKLFKNESGAALVMSIFLIFFFALAGQILMTKAEQDLRLARHYVSGISTFYNVLMATEILTLLDQAPNWDRGDKSKWQSWGAKFSGSDFVAPMINGTPVTAMTFNTRKNGACTPPNCSYDGEGVSPYKIVMLKTLFYRDPGTGVRTWYPNQGTSIFFFDQNDFRVSSSDWHTDIPAIIGDLDAAFDKAVNVIGLVNPFDFAIYSNQSIMMPASNNWLSAFKICNGSIYANMGIYDAQNVMNSIPNQGGSCNGSVTQGGLKMVSSAPLTPNGAYPVTMNDMQYLHIPFALPIIEPSTCASNSSQPSCLGTYGSGTDNRTAFEHDMDRMERDGLSFVAGLTTGGEANIIAGTSIGKDDGNWTKWPSRPKRNPPGYPIVTTDYQVNDISPLAMADFITNALAGNNVATTMVTKAYNTDVSCYKKYQDADVVGADSPTVPGFCANWSGMPAISVGSGNPTAAQISSRKPTYDGFLQDYSPHEQGLISGVFYPNKYNKIYRTWVSNSVGPARGPIPWSPPGYFPNSDYEFNTFMPTAIGTNDAVYKPSGLNSISAQAVNSTEFRASGDFLHFEDVYIDGGATLGTMDWPAFPRHMIEVVLEGIINVVICAINGVIWVFNAAVDGACDILRAILASAGTWCDGALAFLKIHYIPYVQFPYCMIRKVAVCPNVLASIPVFGTVFCLMWNSTITPLGSVLNFASGNFGRIGGTVISGTVVVNGDLFVENALSILPRAKLIVLGNMHVSDYKDIGLLFVEHGVQIYGTVYVRGDLFIESNSGATTITDGKVQSQNDYAEDSPTAGPPIFYEKVVGPNDGVSSKLFLIYAPDLHAMGDPYTAARDENIYPRGYVYVRGGGGDAAAGGSCTASIQHNCNHAMHDSGSLLSGSNGNYDDDEWLAASSGGLLSTLGITKGEVGFKPMMQNTRWKMSGEVTGLLPDNLCFHNGHQFTPTTPGNCSTGVSCPCINTKSCNAVQTPGCGRYNDEMDPSVVSSLGENASNGAGTPSGHFDVELKVGDPGFSSLLSDVSLVLGLATSGIATTVINSLLAAIGPLMDSPYMEKHKNVNINGLLYSNGSIGVKGYVVGGAGYHYKGAGSMIAKTDIFVYQSILNQQPSASQYDNVVADDTTDITGVGNGILNTIRRPFLTIAGRDLMVGRNFGIGLNEKDPYNGAIYAGNSVSWYLMGNKWKLDLPMSFSAVIGDLTGSISGLAEKNLRIQGNFITNYINLGSINNNTVACGWCGNFFNSGVSATFNKEYLIGYQSALSDTGIFTPSTFNQPIYQKFRFSGSSGGGY